MTCKPTRFVPETARLGAHLSRLMFTSTEHRMIKAFDFEDNGRTYSCSVEERRGSTIESWWWFNVTSDVHRYAPFQAVTNDTRASVQERIVKYYTDLLFRRSQPPEPRAHWGQRNRPAARPAEQPAAVVETPET